MWLSGGLLLLTFKIRALNLQFMQNNAAFPACLTHEIKCRCKVDTYKIVFKVPPL